MIIRSLKTGDVNFILSSWLRAYYDALTTYSRKARSKLAPSNDVFFTEHQAKIKELLKTASVHVCTAPGDDDQIIGYIVCDSDTLHFCYVKNVFRHLGVAKKLKSEHVGLKHYSHHTPYSKYVNQGLIFNPYKF